MKFSIGDYLLYYLAKALAFFFQHMPVALALFIGRRLGVFFRLVNRKRLRIAYANIKSALGDAYSPRELKGILKDTYANIGQGIVDVFLLPKINDAYIRKYISFEGFEAVETALSKGNGLIFLTAHFGTWEISHAALPYKGLAYKGIAREQKPYLLNNLLNTYRQFHGCSILMKGPAVKEALRCLRSNGIAGMLVDQDAGKTGIFVDLFNRPASWHRGVIEMALKTKAAIVPGFAIREKGPYVRFKVFEPLKLEGTLPAPQAAKDGLSQYAAILENIIKQYPSQWLWQHRRWKSTPVRQVIVLNDKRTGHLRQSEKVVEIIKDIWKDRGYGPDNIRAKIIDVDFVNKGMIWVLSILSNFDNPLCQGCMRCLRQALSKHSYEELVKNYADIIISCGSSTAGLNVLLSRENNSKSIVVMKPGAVRLRNFSLAVIPFHDRPVKRDNIVVTKAALNLISKGALKACANNLINEIGPVADNTIGVLIGGDCKNFTMDIKRIEELIEGIIKAATECSAEVFVSTSRRTPRRIEDYLKKRLTAYSRCRLLVIANEHNPPNSVEAILGLSDIVFVSEESVSMISECVSSQAYTVVFEQGGFTDKKHWRFLKNLESTGCVETVLTRHAYARAKELLKSAPAQCALHDSDNVKTALCRIL